MTNRFFSEVVQLRGKVYEIRELSAQKYNKTVKQATNIDEETKVENFDQEGHTKILIAQCVTVGSKVAKGEDKKLHLVDGQPIDLDDLLAEGNRVWRAIQKRVLAMNLDEEPEEEIVELVGETQEATASS
ncbi:MAG TPA: hypothetical protein VFX15_02925 [Actinomycetes bacterium]|nr:hypothetical protein [Actinomycetes bacterium]